MLTDEDIKTVWEEIEVLNEDLDALWDNQDYYNNMLLGVHERNGKEVWIGYYCSDICPDYGFLSIYYYNVSDAECTKIGRIRHDPAWGGYIGCEPILD
ncbi:hypothetical protein ACFLZN_02700, partial [Nanoarchaeota archaeon]